MRRHQKKLSSAEKTKRAEHRERTGRAERLEKRRAEKAGIIVATDLRDIRKDIEHDSQVRRTMRDLRRKDL